ncbi:MAG: hypothetical protein CL823_04915 [Crocinitomicaceae bacterium]|nr:hypothetical protein [Crocinitomicaceae bacterium]|tara:strand:+ start:173 stop:889 length:717 start_codon:yes stop_codon:yes gene_type:complete
MAKKAKDDTIINVDEVYTKTEQFVDKNRTVLWNSFIGIVLTILFAAAYKIGIYDYSNQLAETAIFPAEHYLSKDSIDLAQYGDGYSAGLEEIMNGQFKNDEMWVHSLNIFGTHAESRAAYMVGIVNRDAGLFEEAIESFKQVDLNDDIIMPFALAGIGDCYTDLGRLEEAEPYFEDAASSADAGLAAKVIAPNFHYKRALVLIELGRSSEAKDVLYHIITDHPNSKLNKTAEALHASL